MSALGGKQTLGRAPAFHDSVDGPAFDQGPHAVLHDIGNAVTVRAANVIGAAPLNVI